MLILIASIAFLVSLTVGSIAFIVFLGKASNKLLSLLTLHSQGDES